MLVHSSYGNYSVYEIKNESLRRTWEIYYLILIITTLIGDITVLVTSLRYHDAFKLHRFITTLMQHIALSDVALCIFWAAPRVVSLFANSWVLGKHICLVQPHLMYYFLTVHILLTSAMAGCKLSILKFPIRSRYLSVRAANQVCAAIWAVSLNVPATFLDRCEVMFDFRTYSCDLFSSNTRFIVVSVGLNILIPNIVQLSSTGLIVLQLLEGRRASRRSGAVERWQGILTTVFTAAIFSLSVMPFTIYCFLDSLSSHLTQVTEWVLFQSMFHRDFYRFATSALLLNILSNFFVRGLAVVSFRIFLKSRMGFLKHFFVNVNFRRNTAC